MPAKAKPSPSPTKHNAKHNTKWTTNVGWILPAILAVGIFLRIFQFFAHESFWKDEVGLAVNFLTHDLAHITEPFQNVQAIPEGFAIISKLFEMWLGHSEPTFWLISLIASVGILLLAVPLWKKELPRAAWLIATAALAFNTTLIMYVTQFKVYETDAFWALALSGVFLWQQRNSGRTSNSTGSMGWLIYALVGLLALWMSYTSVFVIAGLGLWQIFAALRGAIIRPTLKGGATALSSLRDSFTGTFLNFRFTIPKSFLSALAVNIFLGVVFCFLWLTNYRFLDAGGAFKNFWVDSFAPFIFQPNALEWYTSTFGPLLGYIFGHKQWVLILFFVGVGITWAWKLNKNLLALLLPILVTWAASCLKLYPIYDRLEIFWVPLVTPFLALGIYAAWESLRAHHKSITWVFALAVALPLLWPTHAVIKKRDFQELKQAALVVSAKAKAGDVIYIHPRATQLYPYYLSRYRPAKGVVVQEGLKEDAQDLYTTLKKIAPGRHIFVLYAEPYYTVNEIELLEAEAIKNGEAKGHAEFNMAGIMELQLK